MCARVQLIVSRACAHKLPLCQSKDDVAWRKNERVNAVIRTRLLIKRAHGGGPRLGGVSVVFCAPAQRSRRFYLIFPSQTRARPTTLYQRIPELWRGGVDSALARTRIANITTGRHSYLLLLLAEKACFFVSIFPLALEHYDIFKGTLDKWRRALNVSAAYINVCLLLSDSTQIKRVMTGDHI
ncbi:hypothetical protein BOTBODRAFT_56038 [Botryobasidium botryosum FD-172 SS1]|uniref:Uncharacterized protein n=1 Tax=Botryobasidium botryosum (strain FD-172 SS1) TaxID=930990 RepID=A0A067MFM6_BOTB1|nr:hypothetical protein BOTBODRAFT_56038 [Botryobasidium botryosum FD-172 SS1]